ncbi:SCO family protein [Stratiformator vulcanicus]|uniref:SCO family protein n=1 Tax=Stratiformator vulcanicus TaxID=2527980 RepID=A0A517R2W5_9PLAN|nr:SCO family protein [Stratiformator vulcanicus]QDT38226.1 hypothetical protein Pan189_26160 [Stratiformator vulcanicus]
MRFRSSDRRLLLSTTLVAAVTVCASASRSSADFDPLNDAVVEQRLNEPVPLELEFRDIDGRLVRLADFFSEGRPVLLTMNYSNCPMLCSLQLDGLFRGLNEVDLRCGNDFAFVSVSYDPRELPVRAQQTTQRYQVQYRRGGGLNFLVAPKHGDDTNVRALADALGIGYGKIPGTEDYSHPAAALVVTPDGVISRYFTGVEFDPQALRLSLVEASDGKIGDFADLFFLTCFHYDPDSGTYAPDVARMTMTVAGVATVVILGSVLISFWMRDAARGHELGAPVPPQGSAAMPS